MSKNQTQWNIGFPGSVNSSPAVWIGVWWMECYLFCNKQYSHIARLSLVWLHETESTTVRALFPSPTQVSVAYVCGESLRRRLLVPMCLYCYYSRYACQGSCMNSPHCTLFAWPWVQTTQITPMSDLLKKVFTHSQFQDARMGRVRARIYTASRKSITIRKIFCWVFLT